MDSIERRPALVISLDFELYWGVRDSQRFDRYRENVLGARRAVPALLDLFRRYSLHATWATVGFLFCRTREELLAAGPARRPEYRNSRLDPYAAISALGADEEADPYHYASSLIDRIRSCPSQEIASHTFSHYYCLEPGQDRDAFEADLQAAIAVAGRAGDRIRSLVLPRNQVNEEYLETCAQLGLSIYRGCAKGWMYRPGRSALKGLARFADSYLRLSGANGALPERTHGMVNVPASRFLRPYSKPLAAFDWLRLKRIQRDLTLAAERGQVYHLWWHPHNFGIHLAENLAFLESILRHFDSLRRARGMESLNMAECAARLIRPEEMNDAVLVAAIHA